MQQPHGSEFSKVSIRREQIIFKCLLLGPHSHLLGSVANKVQGLECSRTLIFEYLHYS